MIWVQALACHQSASKVDAFKLVASSSGAHRRRIHLVGLPPTFSQLICSNDLTTFNIFK
ncbi:unnamed protein product, partial [Amoebophrya sp. A25]|eukprot:GSA25T00016076001.1